MQFIKLFLASSIIEFAEERRKIYLSLFNFNDYLIYNTDYEIDIDRCEELDSNILKSKVRTQDKISEMIINSNVCVFLIGNKVGEVTKEELVLAIDTFKQKRKAIPIIYVFKKEIYENSVYDVLEILKNENIPHMYVNNYHEIIYSILCLLEYIFKDKWELFIYNNNLCISDVIIDANMFESNLFDESILNQDFKKKEVDWNEIKLEIYDATNIYKKLTEGE